MRKCRGEHERVRVVRTLDERRIFFRSDFCDKTSQFDLSHHPASFAEKKYYHRFSQLDTVGIRKLNTFGF